MNKLKKLQNLIGKTVTVSKSGTDHTILSGIGTLEHGGIVNVYAIRSNGWYFEFPPDSVYDLKLHSLPDGSGYAYRIIIRLDS